MHELQEVIVIRHDQDVKAGCSVLRCVRGDNVICLNARQIEALATVALGLDPFCRPFPREACASLIIAAAVAISLFPATRCALFIILENVLFIHFNDRRKSVLMMMRRPPGDRMCSAVTFFPFYAAHRMLSCLGYSQSVRLKSGRTVIISSEIAQGGFSFVYKARDPENGESFALKKILCQTDEQVHSTKAEIQAHYNFKHPNIMPLIDYAVISTQTEILTYYLLFPYMENGTLRDMIDTAINQDVRISEAQILDIFLKICRAVAELHIKVPPLAHRDIKPENIMLSDEGEPLLTDFGSVTVADVTISGRCDALLLQEQAACHSSMAYRAPAPAELTRFRALELYDALGHSHITSATDVWSLGCLLYALAFGYSPFECSFYDSGVVRVVECSYLAVIGSIKFPKNCPYSPKFCNMIRWILTLDASARPTVFDIIERLHSLND
ncbi:hypothetical protein CCR75_006317 [Bremia lactucae]|uniref:Protein kinase domain-containing protein n=1 Tax=Bremia lactucae TaxID=4779 RepID=A0A976ID22_BRELC|nr:hypothetical protein CCR75_006317 [Bremia lactucae]